MKIEYFKTGYNSEQLFALNPNTNTLFDFDICGENGIYSDDLIPVDINIKCEYIVEINKSVYVIVNNLLEAKLLLIYFSRLNTGFSISIKRPETLEDRLEKTVKVLAGLVKAGEYTETFTKDPNALKLLLSSKEEYMKYREESNRLKQLYL